MRAALVTCTIAIVLLTYFTAVAPDVGGAPETEVSVAEIRKLREERRDVLAELVQIRQKMFESSRAPFEPVLQARMDLLNAELELAESSAERITAYEGLLEAATHMEQISQQLREQAVRSASDVLECKALRLKVQADLLSERMAASGPE